MLVTSFLHALEAEGQGSQEFSEHLRSFWPGLEDQTMSLLGGIHHVSLNVDDAEAGRAFYEDVLGLTPTSSDPDWASRGSG